jgi:hypothetical protein
MTTSPVSIRCQGALLWNAQRRWLRVKYDCIGILAMAIGRPNYGKAPTGWLNSIRGHTARTRRIRGRIAGVVWQVVFGLVFWPSEPGADPHLHRRRIGAETGAERRHPGPLVVEAHVHWRRAAARKHPPSLCGVSQPHRLKVFRASYAGDAVPAEHHKFCAPSAPAKGPELPDAARRSDAAWQSSQ